MAKKNSSRLKGHNYERKLAQEWRDMGWTNCNTSRYESKILDDQKVDLTNTAPFNIQAKAVERLNASYFDILKDMPQDTNHNLIFHKKNHKGEIVVMMKEDFYEIVDQLIAADII